MRHLFAALWLAAGFAAAPGAEPPVASRVEPELAPDRDLLARIAALPDNTWLKLPPVKLAGDISWCGKPGWPGTEYIPKTGPVSRDYCNRIVWAPERKRALFCGANHQAPHYINDVWEYDLAANTWVCLYAPDPQYPGSLLWPPRTAEKDEKVVAWVKANVVLKDGVVQTVRGGPMRPCHTWWGLCYDTDRRRLLWLDPLRGTVFTDEALTARGLGITPEELKAKRKPAPYIWSFDPAARQWQTVAGGLPAVDQGEAMEYIPELKQVWIRGYQGGPWLYDPDKGVSRDLKAPGPHPRAEMITAYDPAAKTIVGVLEGNTYTYSFPANEWKLVQDKAAAEGADYRSFLCHDPVAGRFVLLSFGRDRRPPPSLWLYDLNANRWDAPQAGGDVPTDKDRVRISGYYDPERDVTVFYGGAGTWVYRARKAAK